MFAVSVCKVEHPHGCPVWRGSVQATKFFQENTCRRWGGLCRKSFLPSFFPSLYSCVILLFRAAEHENGCSDCCAELCRSRVGTASTSTGLPPHRVSTYWRLNVFSSGWTHTRPYTDSGFTPARSKQNCRLRCTVWVDSCAGCERRAICAGCLGQT